MFVVLSVAGAIGHPSGAVFWTMFANRLAPSIIWVAMTQQIRLQTPLTHTSQIQVRYFTV
jgi:hypothetical protein